MTNRYGDSSAIFIAGAPLPAVPRLIRPQSPPRCGWRPGTVDDVADGLMTLFFCGDVMLGRGVDQILPYPGDPELRERYASDARAYVRLAERANGPIPRPTGFSWPWGDALDALDGMAPDARVINLETSVTRSADLAPDKPVHYRMSPDNLPAVTVARPDACALANNHVLDFGRTGLRETLDVLADAGLAAAGAGRDAAGARQPVPVPVPGGGRAVIFSCGAASSGIPPGWAASASGPAWTCCPAFPALPPMMSSPGCRPCGNPVMSSSCRSTGDPTGGMACRR